MNRMLFFMLGFVFAASFVFGAECGPEPTEGCFISASIVFNPGIYKLGNSVRIANDDVVLDCNGATLLGDGSGYGIDVLAERNNYTIKNCNIMNFSDGIHIYHGSDYYYSQKDGLITGNNISGNRNGIFLRGLYSFHILDTNITGNIFYDNENGIYLQGNVNNNVIYKNIFRDNAKNGIYIDRHASFNTIWDNDFYGTGIYYTHTNNYFCRDGVANFYYEGADGPECYCYVAYGGMDVNNYARLCVRIYNLSSNIHLYDSSTLDCNGATLMGHGSGYGVSVMQGHNNWSIKKCRIMNFSDGIHIYYGGDYYIYQRDGLITGNFIFNNGNGIFSQGLYTAHIADTNITNNMIYNNENGIYFKGNVIGSEVHGNIFFDNRDYNLKSNTKYNVSAEYNYWGTMSVLEISKKIYDYYDSKWYGIVYFEPFLSDFTDFYVVSDDISFEKIEGFIRVNALIHKDGYFNDDVKVSFYHLDSDGGLIDNKSILVYFYEMEKIVSTEFDLKEKDLVKVVIEAEPNEANKINNLAERGYYNFPFVYVSSYLFPLAANDAVLEYVKENLKYGYYTDDADKADVLVYIGKRNNVVGLYNPMTLNLFGWGFKGNMLVNKGNESRAPYSGMVGGFSFDGKRYVFIYGNRIEGDAAAVKRFINDGARFLNMDNVYMINKEDVDAIGIYDFMHNEENNGHYNKDSEEFGEIIKAVLYDSMFLIEDKTVDADGVQLRLRNLKPDRSEQYLEYLGSTGVPVEMPVVLATGIHSSLGDWQDFAGEIANTGRDAWLIEITGGPGQDCDECPDYTFDDLTDSYVPALLNKVLDENGNDKLQFIGHSNGCRSVLTSLEKGSFDPDRIETFVGVACPGAFEGNSPGIFTFKSVGKELVDSFEGKPHLSGIEIGKKAEELCIGKFVGAGSFLDRFNCVTFSSKYRDQGRISFNLANQYYNQIRNESDSQPGTGLLLDNFELIYGTLSIFEPLAYGRSDGFVTEEDSLGIYNNVQVIHNKNLRKFYGFLWLGMPHSDIVNYKPVRESIKSLINKKGG